MKIFKRNIRKNNIKKEISSWNTTALNYAASFSTSFDYSENSILELDNILQYYHEDVSESMPTENQLWSMACIWGSYLGETLLKNGLYTQGYNWDIVENSSIPVLKKEEAFITPIDKVYKRLTNGNEDNIISFYRNIIKMI